MNDQQRKMARKSGHACGYVDGGEVGKAPPPKKEPAKEGFIERVIGKWQAGTRETHYPPPSKSEGGDR